MSKLTPLLPHETDDWFLTDAGLETTLAYHDGWDLPHFSAFELLKSEAGYKALRNYFVRFAALALRYEIRFILESPTWRANPDWAAKLGYNADTLDEANQKAIDLLSEVGAIFKTDSSRFLISGCLGPRGDRYAIDSKMDVEQARVYHHEQLNSFQQANVDMVTAITMSYAEEAIGITHAAKSLNIPAVISFTVEKNGDLPSGQSLKDSILQVDKSTANGPIYYMINCAHPQHFINVLSGDQSWKDRIHGIRANASLKGHAELHASPTLDVGYPRGLAEDYRILKSLLKNLNVVGGCCGTDHRHIEEICKAIL